MRRRLLNRRSLIGLSVVFLFVAVFVAAQQPPATNAPPANTASSDSTVLVAWIGFAGAVIAAFIAFETYMVRKKSENNSVNKAVRAEIGRLLEVIGEHQQWWADCMRRGDTNQPLIPFSHAIYAGQVKKNRRSAPGIRRESGAILRICRLFELPAKRQGSICKAGETARI